MPLFSSFNKKEQVALICQFRVNFQGKKRCSIVFLRDVDFSGETGCVTINTHAFWRQVVMRKIFEKKM